MTSLLQLTKHRAVDFTRRVKIIYHVVKFTASLNEDEHELLCHSLACLYNLTTCAHIEDDKNVPILLQNPGFLSHLEYCLTAKQQKLSLSALSLISVMVSCCPDYSISRPISINADFILAMVTWRCSEATVPALKILYLSLETSLSGAKTILSFYRTGNILENGPLFSHRELRQLYCYVQQYLCQENKDIQSYAAKCLLKIMDYSFATNSILGNHFLHHPWHHQLLKSILAQSAQNGLSLCIAEFSNKIWCTDEDSDPEAAKLLLESVMATELFSNNQDTFIKLVNKAKQFCADSSLLKQVESKLSLWAKDNPVSHSSI